MSYEEQDALEKMFQGKPLTDEEKELLLHKNAERLLQR